SPRSTLFPYTTLFRSLLWHGAAGATVFGIGLEHFADLGLHQQLHIGRDLAQRPGHQSQEAADFGDAVACGVPGDLGLTKPKLGRSEEHTSELQSRFDL